MDKITVNFTSLFIDNSVQSNNFEDCVYYYRRNLDIIPPNKLGYK